MAENQLPHRHTIDVRYGEVDRQGVVFNAHYMAYMDHAMETWLRPIHAVRESLGWEMMLKRCNIEWFASVSTGDFLDIDVAVARWGNTSFDLGYRGCCGDRDIFRARVVYVSVEPATLATMVTPAEIREFMGDAIDLLGSEEF
jgi:acyl-CoA thioester hydrolase